MFLRSLTIRGFKSFADKTRLEFAPGVSVIVGPNGSGKSNISDAIAWVLGEQGPRALRGSHMADVIFAGSPGRPPLGMAEATLVIDNSAGLIPVPASEIEISRAIYRSGESEYRLGGRPCRLLDIHELLSDTGMGRALHTIIGQGALDDVLVARPEERRQFVEEAAGIAKHRRRRERAERKLAGLEGDLLRLQDLVAELRRQLKPLKQQAELAERHEALNREAAELAVKLAAARLRDLLAERERRRPAWDRAQERQAATKARLAALDAEISALEARRAEAEETLRGAEERQAAAAAARADTEGRLRQALRAEAGVRERLEAAANRSGRLFALEDELHRTEAALDEVEAQLAAREPELAGAEERFRAAERARRDAEEERRRLAEEAATRRAQAEALRQAIASHRNERGRLRERIGELTSRERTAGGRADELESEIERHDALASPLAKEQAELERETLGLAERLAELEAEEKGLLARQEVVDSRREELSESPGAAFLRRRKGRQLGLLRELVDAPAHLRAAVRAALGPFADAVVYDSSGDAFRDASAGGGSGVVLAIAGAEADVEAWPAGPASGEDVRLPAERPLVEAVRADARVRSLVARLLARAYLVNNLAEASARHRVHPRALFVTPDGMVVGPSFIRMPAEVDVRLEAVRRESAAIERELAAVRRGLREGRQRLERIAERRREVESELGRLDATITAAAEELGRVQAELRSIEQERAVLAERAAAVEAAEDEAAARLRDLAPATPEPPPLPPVPDPPVQLRVEVESLRRERSRLEAGVRRARRDIEELGAEDPVALRAELAQAERSRVVAEDALREAEERLAPAVKAHGAALAAAREAEAEQSGAHRGWREAAGELERLRQEHEQEDRARGDLERRIGDAERMLREGHGVEPSAAVATLGDGDTVDELQRRSDLVARRLGLLGRVNLLASGELEALQQRHDFLVRELEDVRAARRDLETLIRDIDRQVAEQFESAFRHVAAEFSALFTVLFPGGEGRLSLTDPSDLLRSGIEVEARPGGKRVKRLSLLSGGERALAALAFLFAIFRAHPSPFYLMDEVEAALDDVNLHRFLEIVRDFARDSQVLIVTHQKRTMEMADVLYGVSMGRDGASTVISQRLAEVGTG